LATRTSSATIVSLHSSRFSVPVVAAVALLHAGSSFADDFTTSDRYGGHLTDGFVFNNNRWGEPVDNGSLTIKTSPNLFSYWTTHTANNQCCSAPYAGIGTIGGQGTDWTSDQFGQPGSHLPIKLQDIEALKGSWRFKVPLPTGAGQQYHVYYELYICDNTMGLRGKGNIAIGFWDNEFNHQTFKGGKFGTREDVNGYPMAVQFSANAFGQGDFWIVESPTGTYAPDAGGVITVSGFDIKKVIDWGIAKGTYNPQHYLTELNLAFEVMTLPGKTLTTEHASFCVKAKAADVVYTPTWTASEWGPGCSDVAGDAGNGDAGSATPPVADASDPKVMPDAPSTVTTGGGSSFTGGGGANAGTTASEDSGVTSTDGGGCGCAVPRSRYGAGGVLSALALCALARKRGLRRRTRP